MDASIYVYTFKEGLLSKLAHDLRLCLGRFEICVRAGELDARFDLSSLSVEGAMRAGVLAALELSARDKQKIEETLQREVLHTELHREAHFSGQILGTEAQFSLRGALSLRGTTRPLALSLARRGGRLSGAVELRPSDWGIRPFRALGGALRVQDRVRVTVDADAEQLEPPWRERGDELVWTAGASAGRR